MLYRCRSVTPAFRIYFDAAAAYDFSEDDGFPYRQYQDHQKHSCAGHAAGTVYQRDRPVTVNQSIRIDWQAIVDEQHDYFEVEKSADGLNFRRCNEVPRQPLFSE